MSDKKRHPGRSKHEKAMIRHNGGNQYAVKGPKGSIVMSPKKKKLVVASSNLPDFSNKSLGKRRIILTKGMTQTA